MPLSNGGWAVKLGATTLSRWPSHRRQDAIDNAIERAKEFWGRAPVGFKTIVVRAKDADGAAVIVWSADEAERRR
ncbi:MAG: hypothetical protein ABIO37_00875 [Caulobacteraceae bacterium]